MSNSVENVRRFDEVRRQGGLANFLQNHDWAAKAVEIRIELTKATGKKKRAFLENCARLAENQAARIAGRPELHKKFTNDA